MKKYIVLYRAPGASFKQEKSTPEQMKDGMKAWMIWAEKCGKALIDMGSPLGNGQELSMKGSKPSTQNVVGYSILEAKSMEKAKALLKGHPHLAWGAGCEIEVHESLPLPGS